MPIDENWQMSAYEDYDDYGDDYDDDDYFDTEYDHYCTVCGGDGMEDDSSPCPECDGTGIAPEYW